MTSAAFRLFTACWHDCRAAIAVEFALVTPILMILLLGLADYAMGFNALIKLRNAVEAGTSYCLHNGAGSCTSALVAPVVVGATGLPISAADVTLNLSYGCATTTGVTLQANATPNCATGFAPGRYATVSATYNYITTLGQVPIPLSAQTVIRIQ